MQKKGSGKFYSLDRIKRENALYNVIFGERSNGKSYAVEEEIIRNYFETGKQGAIIRRWQLDLQGKRGQQVYEPLVLDGVVKKYSRGEWTGVRYYAGRWFFTKAGEDHKIISQEEPFCYGFSLTDMEHDKSTSYPLVTTILFDEFLSRKGYLPDEFILFMNVLSTIIRYRTDVKIYMLGNTVNKYCPYFSEMGLTHVKDQKPGTIESYTYGESGLKVAVEYAQGNKRGKPSDKYFAFENARLNMITGGAWEIALYPHCPIQYRPKDIKFRYFIKWQEELLQCDVIMRGNYNFTFIHRKTSPLKNPEKDLIFDTDYNSLFNYGRRLTSPATALQKKIAWYFTADKVFYQDNEIGEIVRNYIEWSKNGSKIQ